MRHRPAALRQDFAGMVVRPRTRERCWLAPLILVVLPAMAAGAGQQAVPAGCRVEAVATERVARVIDGRTFILDDGREVRLAGIEIPPAGGAWSPAAATDGLAALIGGRDVTLQAVARGTDRYDRVVAHAVAGDTWIQGELLGRGMAVVASRVGDRTCAAALLAQERAARQARLGLWADPYYAVRRAEDPGAIVVARGQFGIVEGKVGSVRE